jgi:Arc/MetJ-type ribon-helix-helix transcriptional regulator
VNYFIFRITERPIRQLEKLEQHDTYRSASARVRQLRRELPPDSNATVRMIHAETELHAEDLLSQIREPAPELGDD